MQYGVVVCTSFFLGDKLGEPSRTGSPLQSRFGNVCTMFFLFAEKCMDIPGKDIHLKAAHVAVLMLSTSFHHKAWLLDSSLRDVWMDEGHSSHFFQKYLEFINICLYYTLPLCAGGPSQKPDLWTSIPRQSYT